MRYDLSNDLHVQQFKARAEKLIEDNATVELTSKKPHSLRQGAYLHVCINYYALRTGHKAKYVKYVYFKLECNRDIFLTKEYDETLGRIVESIRSTSELTTEEASIAIERFRNWAAEHGEYIPSADEHKALMNAMTEIDRAKVYL